MVPPRPPFSSSLLPLLSQPSQALDDETIGGLLPNRDGENTFEASDIATSGGSLYVVFDNMNAIMQAGELQPLSAANALLPDATTTPAAKAEIRSGSEFEGITLDPSTPGLGYVMVESALITLENGKRESRALVHEVLLKEKDAAGQPKDYVIKRTCPSAKSFSHRNFGFEGLAMVQRPRPHGQHAKGKAAEEKEKKEDEALLPETVLLGLCEGNFCEGGRRGETPGNGRVVVMGIDADSGPPSYWCHWDTLAELPLPQEAYFEDYSAISLRPITTATTTTAGEGAAAGAGAGAAAAGEAAATASRYRVAITSQQNATLWLGELDASSPDPAQWSFASGGRVLHFPRNDNCEVTYCNVEGVAWLDDHTLVGVSDEMKDKGRQASRCKAKDQSIHLFGIPKPAD